MLQPGRRDRGVWVDHPIQADLPKPCRPLEGRPVDAFGVKVAKRGVRAHRENAPAPDARGAMGLPESKVG